MSQELRKLETEYFQLLSEINFQTFLPFVYRKKRVIVKDCDDTQNALGSPSVTENYFLNTLKNHNTKIDFPKIEDYWFRIKTDPLNAEMYARGIFRELWLGELTLYQDIDAGVEAGMITIPVRNIFEASAFLSGCRYTTVELSAGGSNAVNSFLASKVGISRFSNLASKYIYNNRRLFTGEAIFYYGKNRLTGMREIMKKEGVSSKQCIVVDDSLPYLLPSLPLIEILVDGVYICVSEDEKARRLEKSNPDRPCGPKFIVRPDIRENFYNLVSTLSKFEKIQQIGSVLPPLELSKALHKTKLLRTQGAQLLESDEIKFAMDTNDFSNTLIELLPVKELSQSTERLDADSRIKKLRSMSTLEEKRDIVDALVQELDENLQEQGIRDEFMRRVDDLAYRWQF